ncbi:hypothetical protein [Mesobacillus maritimus]|uniref:Uncharacterized protein n=1 Tax=Mesobacillus maritimus TaxID=1643336 RepID=A0ABS7K7F9_9BACI|nr:hypothetical protein [Mesobacillus maritimus]MBY0098207.1 hypothetical protein [Mesobacillus maritimus]
MNKKSIGRELLICQCLSQLPLEDYDCPLIDYGKKFSTKSLIKIFVAAQLDEWDSYKNMEEKCKVTGTSQLLGGACHLDVLGKALGKHLEKLKVYRRIVSLV